MLPCRTYNPYNTCMPYTPPIRILAAEPRGRQAQRSDLLASNIVVDSWSPILANASPAARYTAAR